MLAAVLNRVISQTTGFRQFGVAVTLEDAVADMRARPAFYLYAPRGKASPNENVDDTLLQSVTNSFGALIAVEDVSDGTGAAALAKIEALESQVRTALLNWAPDANHGPIQLSDYLIPYASDGLVIQLDNFTTQHFERA